MQKYLISLYYACMCIVSVLKANERTFFQYKSQLYGSLLWTSFSKLHLSQLIHNFIVLHHLHTDFLGKNNINIMSTFNFLRTS